MNKASAALVLHEIGTLLELQGENPFKVRAFQSAARALESLDGDLAELVRASGLRQVKGLGPATVGVIEELVATGGSSLYRELRERTPDGLLEVLAVPGLGAKRVHLLHRELGIESLDDLDRALAEGRVAGLAGFGARTQEKLREGVAFRRSVAGQRRLPEAWEAAERVLSMLRDGPGVLRVELAGALRRWCETVDGLDLVAAAADRAAPVLAAFVELPGTARGERIGEQAARAWLADGLELRLRCVAPDELVAAWVLATGSESHVEGLADRARERGLRLDEFGLWDGSARIPLEEESELYARLGLGFVPPELREDGLGGGEPPPPLVKESELRGCFHCHTHYSDGKESVAGMAAAARDRGWRYLGLADHSQAAGYAGGLSTDDIARQHEEIDAWNADHGHELWIFKGVEADILPDGRLDYAEHGDEVLGSFDYVVGSVHSGFGQGEAEMTARVLRALENPHVTFLGHPTGRLLLSRAGYAIDMGAVIEAAAERGVGIELNANPWRLDMDWRHWRRAREKGVRCAINPDAHSIGELDYLRYGVGIARKGGLAAADVVNTWDLDRVRTFFEGGVRS